MKSRGPMRRKNPNDQAADAGRFRFGHRDLDIGHSRPIGHSDFDIRHSLCNAPVTSPFHLGRAKTFHPPQASYSKAGAKLAPWSSGLGNWDFGIRYSLPFDIYRRGASPCIGSCQYNALLRSW